MNEARRRMDSELKKTVFPKLREMRFKGSGLHFRRINEKTIDLITFQFDRSGGGFVIELAQAPNEIFQSFWRDGIEPKKLTAHDLSDRIRIHPKGLSNISLTDDWFRYDKNMIMGDIYKKVAKEVVSNCSLIEDVFLDFDTHISNPI